MPIGARSNVERKRASASSSAVLASIRSVMSRTWRATPGPCRAVAQHAQADLRPDPGPVGARQAQRRGEAVRARGDLRQGGGPLGQVVGMRQVARVAADQVVGLAAEQLAAGGREVGEPAVRVEDDEQVRRGLREPAGTLLGGDPAGLGLALAAGPRRLARPTASVVSSAMIARRRTCGPRRRPVARASSVHVRPPTSTGCASRRSSPAAPPSRSAKRISGSRSAGAGGRPSRAASRRRWGHRRSDRRQQQGAAAGGGGQVERRRRERQLRRVGRARRRGDPGEPADEVDAAREQLRRRADGAYRRVVDGPDGRRMARPSRASSVIAMPRARLKSSARSRGTRRT